ncbi:MAG: ATP-binding protein [Anaerolineae bacterium]
MKLVTKLTALFLLLATIPLAVVGYLAYDNGRRTIEQNMLNHLISTNILKQGEFDRWVRGNERSLRGLARRPLVREYAATLASYDPDYPEYQAAYVSLIEDYLSPTLEEEGGFLDLSILRGDDGWILISTDKGLEGKYRESELFFVEGRSRTYVENVSYSLSLGEVVMHISTPIVDREGHLIAVLIGHADLGEMSGIMEQRSGLSQTEDSYLVNTFNFFVTEPMFGQDYALKKAVRTEGVEACLQRKDGVGFYDDYRGVPVIGAYHWLEERELCILTEVDQAEAYAPIVALRNIVLGIAVGVALVVATLGVLFARTITEPVRQLVRGAGEIGGGNLDYRIEVRGRDEIGQLAGAFNDMAAKRKWAEQALRESEQWLSTTLKSIGDAVIATDAQGLVTLMNPVAENLTGWGEAEAMGKPLENVFDIINEQTGERAENPVARVLREGIVVGLANHTVLIARDGTKWPIADSGAPMRDEQGNIIGTVMVFRDVTKRVQAEKALRENSAQLEAVNAELADFAYVVSHDLKAPLRAISQLANWISDDYAEILDEDGQEKLHLLTGRTKRMHNLIEGILQHSRIGRVTEEERSVDLNRLVQEAVDSLAPPEHIQITVQDELPTVVGERTRLGQVFQNLLGNAIKFMDKAEGRVSIGCADEGAHWLFSVADNGPGIDEKYYGKIFQIFQTLAPRDKVEGTGVGLALVKKIVETWGGRVWVEPTVGKGSTFYFTLPKKRREK